MRHNLKVVCCIASLFTGATLVFSTPAPAEDDLWSFQRKNNQESSFFKVTQVISADLIELENGERVQLIGLKALAAPRRADVEHDEYGFIVEKEDPSRPIEDRAFAFAYRLLHDKKVRLEFDARRKSPDFDLYAYVFLEDGSFANTEILRQGYANLQLIPPNMKYAEDLRAAYREAREERRGLHGDY